MAPMLREFCVGAVDGRSDMKPTRIAPLAIAVVLGLVSVVPAYAAPPTATPSPGYDARLQEQRAASARANEQVVPATSPPRRPKRQPKY